MQEAAGIPQRLDLLRRRGQPEDPGLAVSNATAVATKLYVGLVSQCFTTGTSSAAYGYVAAMVTEQAPPGRPRSRPPRQRVADASEGRGLETAGSLTASRGRREK